MTKDQVVTAGAPADATVVRPADAALFENHLELAAYLRGWATALAREVGDDRRAPVDEADFLRGYGRALVDLAGHLSIGDALPGGPLAAR
ncbi:hypothetical protein [Agilicoccus flavus]|uniref:hypothetical protein n=1 Tax=Agilicoccus flavus TaxID=2775968 RepID=UPI001CF6B4E1|nr:hypothetical protein [Agilicoccus flavus]